MQKKIYELAEMLGLPNPVEICESSDSGERIGECWCQECREYTVAWAAVRAMVKKTTLHAQL